MIVQGVVLLLTLAAPSQFGEPSGKSEIRDNAKMFSAQTAKECLENLRESERLSGVPTLIETVDTLSGETVEEVARHHAAALGDHGLYVLIAKRESKLDVLLSKRYNYPQVPKEVKEAFVTEFKNAKFDMGLSKATLTISKLFDKPVVPMAKIDTTPMRPLSLPGPHADPVDTTVESRSLVLKNQYRLTLEGARAVLGGAELKAAAMNQKMNITVVDDGGHLLCFVRMDGGRPASAATSITKAVSAATFRQATGTMPKGIDPPDILLSLSVQSAAAASGAKITTLLGGLPIMVEGQIIGAIGVGGGTGEQDAEVARAGIEAFLKRFEASENQPKPKE